jgi:hypothetical protein
MAIKVNGTTVINDSRALSNIASVDATTVATLNAGGVGGSGFEPTTVSGTSQALNVGSFNFFDAGANLSTTSLTTLSFSSVPTEARWQYSYVCEPNDSIGYSVSTTEVATSTFYDSRDIFLPYGVNASPNGLYYYIWDYYGNLHQYTLSTAYNMSTASFTRQLNRASFPNHQPEQGSYQTAYFKSDGTKLLMVSGFNDAMRLLSWDLSTAWNISTLSNGQSLQIGSNNALGEHVGMDFKSDGTAFFLSTSNSTSNSATYKHKVLKYTLSTAFNVTTASFDSDSVTFASDQDLNSLRISDDGKKIFVNNSSLIDTYELTTAYDVTSINTTPLASSQAFISVGVTFPMRYFEFWDNGTKLVGHQGSNGAGLNHINLSTTGLNVPVLPSSVVGSIDKISLKNNSRVTVDFVTTNGGTNVNLIGQEVV